MIHASDILVIIGSVRPRRIAPAVARWVADIGAQVLGPGLELVDLKDWPLPMDDEPAIPAQGLYAAGHTQAWSRKIAAAKGFVFVTPQYNWGYPAVLKNALDHLYAEWSGKPAVIVTYGGHGGGRCAGQLRQVLKGLHMKPVPVMPALTLPRPMIEANSGEADPAALFAGQARKVRKAMTRLAAAL